MSKFLVTARIRQLQLFTKRFFVQLNIYERHRSTLRQLHYQRIATRLYILLFLVSLTALISYTLTTDEIYQQTIFRPLENQFEELEQMYPNILLCPCGVVSASCNTFIELKPMYHQVCSSDMVSQLWIDILNSYPQYITNSYLEFRAKKCWSSISDIVYFMSTSPTNGERFS